MIRVKIDDFKKMYGSPSYNDLYHRLLPMAEGQADGSLIIRNEELRGEAFIRQFAEWLRTLENLPLTPAAPAAPAPTPASTPADDLARLQKAQREEAEATAKAIEQAAQTRVVYYIREQGMLADDDDQDNYNLNLIMRWFEVNKAQFTSYNVDVCVAQLASQLRWAVWSPRVQPVEEVRTLENGEPELPLNASPDVIRRASKAQVDDLSRRKSEFTAHRRGSFGASFIKPTF